MPYLSTINIYTFKSFEAVTVDEARIAPAGSLEHDREFAIFDANGKYVNGKRNVKVHGLRVVFSPGSQSVRVMLRDGSGCREFCVSEELGELDAWLSAYFDEPVTVRRNTDGGFPDDPKAPGPTVIGVSTLDAVAGWYDGIDTPETRRRFRANLEIGGAPPFWEDRLYAMADDCVRFWIGDVLFEGTNPCQRCVVPTRDTFTGEITDEFANTFRQRREELLPDWAEVSRFNHYYRLAVNTRVPASEVGKVLRVGDPVIIE